jgi:hypothetical protein
MFSGAVRNLFAGACPESVAAIATTMSADTAVSRVMTITSHQNE